MVNGPSGKVKPHQAIEKPMRGNLAATVMTARTIHNIAYPHMIRPRKRPIPWKTEDMSSETKVIPLAMIPSLIIAAPPWPSGPIGRKLLTRTSFAGNYPASVMQE